MQASSPNTRWKPRPMLSFTYIILNVLVTKCNQKKCDFPVLYEPHHDKKERKNALLMSLILCIYANNKGENQPSRV